MSAVVRHIRPIMLVSGLLTSTMVFAALAPEAAMRSTFGQTIDGPLASILVRNWGALVALVGGMLIYGAFVPSVRVLAVAVAGLSKLTFAGLVVAHGGELLSSAAVAVVFDLVTVALFALYLLAHRARRDSDSPADGASARATVDAGNLDLARRYLARLSNGAGPEELETFFAADARQEEFPNRLMPQGATRDLEAMKQGRSRGQALLASEHYELVDAVASDGRVATEVIWTATVREAAGPFAAGQSLRARFAVFMEFRDGRIVRQRNYDCFDPW